MLVTHDNLPDFLDWLRRQRTVAVDTETTGTDPYGPRKDRICGLAVYAKGTGWYLPVRHGLHDFDALRGMKRIPEDSQSDHENLRSGYREALDILDGIVRRGGRLLTWFAKFDLHMMCADGFPDDHREGIDDYMLSSHLLNENEPSYGLKEMSDKYGIGAGSRDEQELRQYVVDVLGLSGTDKSWKGMLHRARPSQVAPYAVADVELTWKIAERNWPLMMARNLNTLFAEVNAYNLLTFRMERRGIMLDRDRILDHIATSAPAFQQAQVTLRELIAGPLQEAQDREEMPWPKIGKSGKALKIKTADIPLPLRLTPATFNPGSPSQIKALFPHWPKTDVAYLDSLEADDPDYPFAQAILDYRVLSKMKGTYYDAYLSLMDNEDTIRPNYNLHGTVTGRLSCSKPNLQNVPRYTKKRKVKEVFISRPGYRLIEVDYAQAELRITAHYANDQTMIKAFVEGRDLHMETTIGIGLDPTQENRHIGKTMNFAAIYGAGARAITKLLKCDPATARTYLDAFFDFYPGVRRLADSTQRAADQYGVIVMETGRRCNFKYRDTNGRVQYYTFRGKGGKYYRIETRKAMNRLVQGTSAEMLRVAMSRIDDAIQEAGIDAHLLLQVHDSVMFEVAEDALEAFRPLLRPAMTDFPFYPAPDIDAKIGDRWSDMKPWEV